MKTLPIILLAVVASVCTAQNCTANVDRTEQMKAAVIAGHGQGAYFEVNGCHWVPGKNPRDKTKTVKPTPPPEKSEGVTGGAAWPVTSLKKLEGVTVGATWNGTLATATDNNLYTTILCGGWDFQGAKMGTSGVCHLDVNLHYGPDDADCRFVASEDGRVLKISCTWRPK
jgi:hypothetical protein